MANVENSKDKTQNEPQQQAPPLRSYGSIGRSTNRLSSTIAQFEQQSQTSNNSPAIKRSPTPVKPTRQLPVPQNSTGNNIEKSPSGIDSNSTNSIANRPKSRTIGPALAKQLSHNGEDKPANVREIFANTGQDNNNNIDHQPTDSKNNFEEDDPKSSIEVRRNRGVSESHIKRAAVFTTIRMPKDKIDNQLSKPLPAAPLAAAKTVPATSSNQNSPKFVKSTTNPAPSPSSAPSGKIPKKPLPAPTANSISSYPTNSDTSQVHSKKPLPSSSNPEFGEEDSNVDITNRPLPAPAQRTSVDDSSINYQGNHTLEKKGRKLSFRGSLDSRKDKDKEPPAQGEEAPSSQAVSSPAPQRDRSKTLKRLITTKLFNKGEEATQTSPPRNETISEPSSPSGPSTFETSSSEPQGSPTKERTKSARKLPQLNKNTFRFLKQNKKNLNSKLAEHLRDAEGEISAMFGSLMEEFDKMDIWTTKPHVDKNWNEVEQEESQIEPEIRCLLNIDRAKAEGFRFEFGRNFVIYIPVDKSGELIIDVEDAQKDIPYYLEFFADKNNPVAQFHYMNDGEEERAVGPVVITIEAPSVSGSLGPISSHMSFNSGLQAQEDDKRAIIRTKKGTERIFIPAAQCAGKTAMIKYIKSVFPDLGGVKLQKMPTFLQDSIEKKLIEFEKQSIVKRYKFGLLHARDGQTDENEMFSNNAPTPDYEEFLEWLGERITLKGWSKYRGGLDVKTNTTGTHSVYTEHRGYEIMFHVSTLLPFQPDDLQRVERKRHLGNDVVVLIFKEGDTPFDPLCLTTHFNHVFVVIQKDPTPSKLTHYRIAIANKLGVPPYSPYLSSPAIYPKNDEFRDILLTKLINGERASMHAPDFRGKMLRTNKTLLEDMAKDFLQRAKEKPKSSDKSSDVLSSSPTHGSAMPSSTTSDRSERSMSAPASNRSSRSYTEAPVIAEIS